MTQDNVQPMTRSIGELVEALKKVEAELAFQTDRLSTKVSGRTADEVEHLLDMRNGYENSRKYIGILRRYQEGRLARLEETGTLKMAEPSMDGLGPQVSDANA